MRAFGNLSFPEPEGGVVNVIYPLMFSLGDDAPRKPTPRKAFTVANKKKVVDVDAATLVGLVENEKQAAEAITLGEGAATRSPFVVFVRTGESVSTVRRMKLDAKDAPPVHGIERVAPDGWALRVEGDLAFVTRDILDTLVDQ